ncbi:MAG: TonB-dependent receptor [Nitrospirae bacterium]|nr:TonB-dependent receptor [Nitrospirota bacterium]
MKKYLCCAMALAAALAANGPIWAVDGGEKTQKLEEVVVTGTRTERTTEEVPAAVTAVTKEEIADTRMFGIKEALDGIAGVQSETKNGGYDSRLIIRGAGLKARYGVREIMVLLDGVPITDPDGMTRLDFVDTQLIDRIDVVKGPNSTLYGANAAGGVINIITKSPFSETKSIKAGFGSDNTRMFNAIFGSSVGNTYYTLAGSRKSTDSWREWNKFSTTQGSLKLGHTFDDKRLIEANISYTKADIQLPGSLTRDQYMADISQLTSEPWRNSGRYSHVLNTSIKYEQETGNIKFMPLVYFEKWEHYHPVTGLINDGGASVYGTDIQVDMKHKIAGGEAVLTTGVTGQLDKADSKKYTYRDVTTNPQGRITSTTSDEKGDLAATESDDTSKWGLYMQESLRPSDRWIIDAGARYDQVAFDINSDQLKEYSYSTGKYADSAKTINRDKTFDYISPRIGVVFKANNTWNVYGNISTGFQTPQSSELSVNPDLNPSETLNYETGLKGRFDSGASIDLSVFHMTVKNDIVQTYNGSETTYSNAGKSRKNGLELTGKFQPVQHLFIGGSYAYSDFKYVDFTEPVKSGSGATATTTNEDRSGNHFAYIPTNQYSVFVTYRHPSGLRFKVDTNTWGEYYMDNKNTEKYTGYSFITNALVGWEHKNLDVSFDVSNIFGKKYAMEVAKDTSNKVTYKPGSPTTWMARVSYTF